MGNFRHLESVLFSASSRLHGFIYVINGCPFLQYIWETADIGICSFFSYQPQTSESVLFSASKTWISGGKLQTSESVLFFAKRGFQVRRPICKIRICLEMPKKTELDISQDISFTTFREK
jgi:hypothetical protein